MNTTVVADMVVGTGMMNGGHYIGIAASVLLLISEILPFLRKTKSNGMVHLVVCALRGSQCMLGAALDTLEKPDTVDETATQP